MVNLTPKTLKIIKTCNLYLGCVVFGMCFAIPGPTLLDLQHIIKTDTEHIAFVYTARSIGYLIGSFVGGMIFDFIKWKQLILIICASLKCLSILGVPWSRSFEVLTTFMAVNGAAMGAFDTCCNVYLLNLWGKDSAPYYQALHFTFGVGGLISPLIAAPFLGSYNELQSESFNYDNVTFSAMNLTDELNSGGLFANIPKITYAYSIVGATEFLVVLIYVSTFVISPTDEYSEKEEAKSSIKQNPFFFAVVIGLVFALLFIQTGAEIGYAQMITPYAVKGKLKLPITTGSYMTSAFWAAFTISRFSSVFMAMKFTNLTLIVYDLIVTSVAAVFLTALSSHVWALWLSSVLFGIGIASFFPATVAWFGTHINVTNKIAGVFVCSAAFGELAMPFAISYNIETTPEVFIYMIPASCACSTLIVLAVYLILRNSPSNPEVEKQPSSDVGISTIRVSE
ncbi:sodium-dependent glucose transporter 1-like [Uloborus diversus]|uniref:sodium-dependent glucose transporter 1-like n=1 Tax=Uloborus diversus TaxID=327109 RepID=UPI002409BEC9|nr:sodium-dependent glucose transporter 1-like [Uloborus diversus]